MNQEETNQLPGLDKQALGQVAKIPVCNITTSLYLQNIIPKGNNNQ